MCIKHIYLYIHQYKGTEWVIVCYFDVLTRDFHSALLFAPPPSLEPCTMYIVHPLFGPISPFANVTQSLMISDRRSSDSASPSFSAYNSRARAAPCVIWVWGKPYSSFCLEIILGFTFAAVSFCSLQQWHCTWQHDFFCFCLKLF